MLDRLDKLFSHRKGDEISRSGLDAWALPVANFALFSAFFVTQLRELFEETEIDSQLREQVESFLYSINHFLDLLLGIRNLPDSEEWQDDRVIGTLRLMAFIEKRHRSIFIRYVHRLVDYHVASKQYAEAGLTLRLHADLYSFDPGKILPPMEDLDLQQQSEFNRKELLYLRILDYLSKGKAYEIAISVSKSNDTLVFGQRKRAKLIVHSQFYSGNTKNTFLRIRECLSY